MKLKKHYVISKTEIVEIFESCIKNVETVRKMNHPESIQHWQV